MNKLKLKITEQAKADITSIVEYIAKDNKTAAYATAAYLYSVCQNLVGFPEIGTSRPDFTYKNYRFLTIKKRYIMHTEWKKTSFLYQECFPHIKTFMNCCDTARAVDISDKTVPKQRHIVMDFSLLRWKSFRLFQPYNF